MFSKKLTVVLVVFQTVFVHSLCHVWFTPKDDIKRNLLHTIEQERKSIDVAMYMFTDKQLAQSLIDAHIRGVKVRIILDQASMGRFGKGAFLQSNGLEVLVHATETFNVFSTPIMHHKFLIFGSNGMDHKTLVWTGSFNCTGAASRFNYENALLSDDVVMIKQYQLCFQELTKKLQKT